MVSLAAPSHRPSCSLQTAAMHSDCMFKQEQVLCLEKIRKANELMGLNASSLGESAGGEDMVSQHIHSR